MEKLDEASTLFPSPHGGCQPALRCVLNQKPDLPAAAFNMCKQTFFKGRLGGRCFLPSSSALIPGATETLSSPEPVKNCFFVFCSLVDLMDGSPIGFHSSCFGGPSFKWESYKLGCQMQHPNPLLLREKLEVESSLPFIWHCARGGIYGKSVSQSFLPVLMSVLSR